MNQVRLGYGGQLGGRKRKTEFSGVWDHLGDTLGFHGVYVGIDAGI